MEFKRLSTTVLILSVFALGFVSARTSNWNSLSFGPDFERQWAFDENRVGSNMGPRERSLKPSARIPSQVLTEENGGKLNRKNCFLSPVQCSFYFKRSVRSARYI